MTRPSGVGAPVQWISVDEDLPEFGHVLVWCTLWRPAGEVAIGTRLKACWDVEGTRVASECVTHWMPLPKAPAELNTQGHGLEPEGTAK